MRRTLPVILLSVVLLALALGAAGGTFPFQAGGASPVAAAESPDPEHWDGPFDLLLVGGRLVDGTGNAWRYADVGIAGDRITAVAPSGRLDRSRALEVVDVSGLVVAPGFIDLNGQSDGMYMTDGSALSKIFQGVTTEIMGESNTPAPLNRNVTGGVDASDTTAVRRAREWVRFDAWLEEMERGGVALNVGSFLGGTTVRRWALGMSERTPTPAEVDSMRAVTRRSMEEGAFGVATALIYAPGAFAQTDELVEVSRVVAEYGGVYITHLRSESYFILEALDEAIEIGERSGVPVEIYHLKLAGVDNWGLTDQVVEKIEGARARGIDVSAGMYPYTAASTGLTACFPPWVQADGNLYRNLADPGARARIRAEMTGPPTRWENWCRLATPEGSRIASVSNRDHMRWIGKSLADVAQERGVDWVDVAMDLVLADRSRVGMIYFAMDEDNVRRKLTLPWMKFGTDGSGWNPRGAGGQPHPRAYGTYPRILGQYVREEGVITLEDAVRKSSWAAAERIGLAERGLIVEGFYADVVVFDPETVAERSTFEQPHQLAEGMVHVLVNGVGVIRSGEATDARPGRFVRGPGAVLPHPGR
ncbi:MAG: D-aminoacylase [Gemmatimonadales bacterium]|nr:MAG: D-aminoacylase [Gemmatimonadales bacterium]